MPQNHLAIEFGNWDEGIDQFGDNMVMPEGYDDEFQAIDIKHENKWGYRWYDSGFGYCTDNLWYGVFDTKLEAFQDAREVYEMDDDSNDIANWDKMEAMLKAEAEADDRVREKLTEIGIE